MNLRKVRSEPWRSVAKKRRVSFCGGFLPKSRIAGQFHCKGAKGAKETQKIFAVALRFAKAVPSRFNYVNPYSFSGVKILVDDEYERFRLILQDGISGL